MFHFNKKHLEDETIPMWVLKAHGETFYVNHVDAQVPWSTKETPDNAHTKGSLKFKKCKLTIDEDNCATLSKLTLLDCKLPTPAEKPTRIIAGYWGEFHKALNAKEYRHSTIKEVSGGCGSSFIICDLLDKRQTMLASIKYSGKFRVLNPNEAYFQSYDTHKNYIPEEFDDDDY